MPPTHYNRVADCIATEWLARTPHLSLEGAYTEHDGNRYWWIYDRNGHEIVKWECRPFPGCATLVITSHMEVREDLRGQGLGSYFRKLQHAAYKRAGFAGELATVRSDNGPQNAIMQQMSCVSMGEFASDFGGSFKLWLTTFKVTLCQTTALPNWNAPYARIPIQTPVQLTTILSVPPSLQGGFSRSVILSVPPTTPASSGYPISPTNSITPTNTSLTTQQTQKTFSHRKKV